MSTIAPTLSIDQAADGAVRFMRDDYLDAGHLNSGLWQSWRDAFGEKMGKMFPATQVAYVPLAVREHATTTSFGTPAATFNFNVNSTDEVMAVRPARVARPILFDITEIDACGDQAGLTTFFSDRYKMTVAACERELQQHIVAGGVMAYITAVQGGSPVYSFNGIDRSTYGLAEHRAMGAQTNVLGGFSKATWASKPQTQNVLMDVGGAFASNGLTKMFALITKMNKYRRNMKGRRGLITEACFNNYKRSLQANERYAAKTEVDGGWMPVFGDVPLYVEEYLPISTVYGGSNSATDPMSLLIYNANSTYPMWTPGKTLTANGTTIKIPDGRFGINPLRQLPQGKTWATEVDIGVNLYTVGFAELGVLIDAEAW